MADLPVQHLGGECVAQEEQRGRISFTEYMSLVGGDTGLNFNDYRKLVGTTGSGVLSSCMASAIRLAALSRARPNLAFALSHRSSTERISSSV